MRSPPITSGYSRPSSDLTFSIASLIACAFSSLLKSVKGSLRNSAGIRSSKLFLRDSSLPATKGKIRVGGGAERGRGKAVGHFPFVISHFPFGDPKASLPI